MRVWQDSRLCSSSGCFLQGLQQAACIPVAVWLLIWRWRQRRRAFHAIHIYPGIVIHLLLLSLLWHHGETGKTRHTLARATHLIHRYSLRLSLSSQYRSASTSSGSAGGPYADPLFIALAKRPVFRPSFLAMAASFIVIYTLIIPTRAPVLSRMSPIIRTASPTILCQNPAAGIAIIHHRSSSRARLARSQN